ncbi:hypothetical protein [Pseudomonas baetica]|uniref:hypothetical protein n=1 Tax=Pseudomonas baetica TaxID=674054 RepID=UPI0024050FCA|nr:hypothetical protein [Pseudomonas baetica]MDF9778839.1 hypothetical protein [Pseudomonas baetica]
MTITASHIRPMKFSRFAVERCIRVLVDGYGHFIHPIDSRQVQFVLEPIARDIGFGPDFDYSLIETEVDGHTYAMVVEAESEFDFLARLADDPEIKLASGDFGGVWWRVVGFEEGIPDDPFVLATTECEDSAQCTCMSLQVLLEPARVAVRLVNGEQIETVCNRPAEVMLLNETDEASDDDEESPSELDSASPWAGIKPTAAMVVPEKIHSLWDQSR